MDETFINEHAFKHGVSAESIASAWENFVAKRYRGAPNEGEVVAVGYDGHGRFIQMIAVEKPYGTLIIHAMTPPTEKALRELGMLRR